jgi:RNA polymerase sigma factor (sigma-70 family)
MPNRATNRALGQLHKLLSPGYHLTDEQLLQRFVTQRDESAFAALFKRHGSMVLGVCLSVLRHTQDAEDACQASFLVLVRKAASIRARESVASWLHGVAYRLARKLEATRARKHAEETHDRPPPNPIDELNWREVREIIHVELQRLPRTYQLPIILCYLEGQTQDEAAKRLAWTAATLKGRLDRGREMLRRRLTRRGLALEVTLLSTILIPASSPAALASATVRAAVMLTSGQFLGKQISAQAAALVQDGIKAMLVTKLKMMAGLVLTLGTLVGSVGWAALQADNKQHRVARHDETKAFQVMESEKTKQEISSRVDLHGDPLPSAAVARIGTIRFVPDTSRGLPLASTMAYTPDGKYLVCRTGEAVSFFDSKTGKEMRRIEVQGHEFYSFAFSPNGKWLATLGSQNPTVTNEVCLWDVATLKEVHRITDAIIRTPDWSRGMGSIAFAPDGKTFAATKASGAIHLWDIASWQEKPELSVGEHFFYHFLPDGKTLILANHDGFRWWDISTAKEIRRLDKIQTEPSLRLSVSPDGKRLAVLGKINVLHLLNAATGEETARIAVDAKSEYRFCFSPDSQTLAYGAGTHWEAESFETVFISADTGRELRRWGKGVLWDHMAYSPDGTTVAQLGALIDIRDPNTGQTAVEIPRLPECIMSACFSLDNKSLIVCTWDGQVGSWNPRTGKQLAPYQAPPQDAGKPRTRFRRTNFSAAGKVAALVDAKGILYVWEPETGKTLCRIEGQSTMGGYADISPDGKFLAVDDKDHALGLWSVTSGNLIRSLPTRYTYNRVFSADGRVLATARLRGGDSKISLWETATGKEIRKFSETAVPVSGLAISPDCKHLISIHNGADLETPREEEYLRIWDLATGRELRSFPPTVGSRFGAMPPVISPDGKTLATASGTINLWEVTTGKERARYTGHRSSSSPCAFSHDGRLLVSGSTDYTALIWDVTGISPDGKLLPRDVNPAEIKRLWSDLGGADAANAYRAVWLMVAAPRQSVSFLAERLRPVPAISGERIARLITELESEQFNVRTQASKELEQMGELAEPALSKALAGTPSLELRQRANKLLDAFYARPLSSEQVRDMRALEVLEHVATPEARRVLETLANGAPGARLTREAQASLERMGKRGARVP